MPGPDLSISRQPSLHQLAPVETPNVSEKSAPQLSSPNQRRMAMSKLTPPPTPKELSSPRETLVTSASSKADAPPKPNACPSRKEVAERLLDQAKDKATEARQMGVDVAKSTFWKKSLIAMASAVGVGVAAGLTAISFGGAAPLLGLACASMAVSVGDAACAYRNFKNTEATAENRPLPYAPLKAGNSIIGNLTFELVKKVSSETSDETALKIAKGVGVVVAGGLAIATVALSVGLAAPPMAFDLVTKSTSALNSVASGYSALATAMTRDLDKSHMESLQHECSSLTSRAKDLSHEVDVTGIHESSLGATKLLEEAEGNTGFARDAVVGVAGILAPVGTLTFGAVTGHHSGDPGSNGVRV